VVHDHRKGGEMAVACLLLFLLPADPPFEGLDVADGVL
jgi:hypothetical protein